MAVLKSHPFACVVVFGMVGVLPLKGAQASDKVTMLGDKTHVSRTVTVYSGGFAHVQDAYKAALAKGLVNIQVQDLPQGTSQCCFDFQAEGLSVQEVSFQNISYTAHDYLRDAIGKKVIAVRENPRTGRDHDVEAILLSVDPIPVLQIDGQIEVNFPGRIVLPLHDEKVQKPGLTVKAVGLSDRKSKRPVTLQYKLPNVQWQANYFASYDRVKNTMRLIGKVGVTNASQADLRDMTLRVVSGQVNQVADRLPTRSMSGRVMKLAQGAAYEMASTPDQVSGYNLYQVAEGVSLGAGEHKDYTLFDRVAVPVKATYLMRSPVYLGAATQSQWQRQGAELRLGFDNNGQDKAHPQPMPAGVIRVVTPHASGVDVLLGEARLSHVADGGHAKFQIGQAVDVAFTAKRLDFKNISPKTTQQRIKIVAMNDSDQSVNAEVTQSFPETWQIISESLPHTKTSSQVAQWDMVIPPHKASEIIFSVKITRDR